MAVSVLEAKAEPTVDGGEGRPPCVDDSTKSSNRLYLLLLFALWLFHVANNAYYLLTTDSPPNYDCGFHLQLSLHTYRAFTDFESENYLKGVYFATGFYPFFSYTAAVPFYAVLGLNQSAAIAGNLLFLALLILSTFFIGRRLHSPTAGFIAAGLISFFPFVFGVSRNYYIENGLLAVTALSFLCLLKSERFADRKWSLLFGLSIGLGMMTKWTFAIQLFLPVVWTVIWMLIELREAGRRRTRPPHPLGWILLGLAVGVLACSLAVERRPLWAFAGAVPLAFGVGLLAPWESLSRRSVNLGIAGLAAVAVCYPWYIRYWDLVIGVADHFFDPEKTGQAAPWTLGALLYYPFAMQSNLLGPALFVLFILSVLLFPWRKFARYGVVFAWILGAYLVISNIPIRDPRYIAPFLGGIAVVMGISLASVPWVWIRRILYSLAAVAAVWQFGMMTFEWPLPAGNHWRIGPYGNLYSFWNHGVYGTARDRTDKWPHRQITAEFREQALSDHTSGEKPTLRCLVDYPAVHQGVFQYLAMAEGDQWAAVFERNTGPLEEELNRWMEADAVLFPTAPLEGDFHRLDGGRHPFEFDRGPHAFLRVRFPHRTEYPIPTGDSLILAHRDRSGVLAEEESDGIEVSDRLILLSAKAEIQPQGAASRIKVSVRIRYLNIDDWPSDELNRIEVEIYSPEGEFLDSVESPFPPGFETGQEEEFHLEWSPSDPTTEGVVQVAIRVSSGQSGESADHVSRPPIFLGPVFRLGNPAP